MSIQTNSLWNPEFRITLHYISNLYVNLGILPKYMSVHHFMSSACGGQKRVTDTQNWNYI